MRTCKALWAIALCGQMAVIPADAAETRVAATPWVEAQAARVRLLAGADPAQLGKVFLAGVEIAMADGWKTYWRHPGEAGVPPHFDWSGSSNTASIKVMYPAPVRLIDPAAEMIGYKTSVLFPIEIAPQTPTEAVTLRLALEFAVCREICIPAQAAMDLMLPAALLKGPPALPVAAARDRVPRPGDGRRADDPQLLGVTAKLEGPAPSFIIEASFPQDGAGADVFIEAPAGLFVPMAQKLPGRSDGKTRFAVDLSRGGSAEALRGKELVLTLVSDRGASEATWTVP
jgi:DsbC/DsbD-like thiol-disulfide interchange protein